MYKVWMRRPKKYATLAEATKAATAYERATGVIVAITSEEE